MGVLIWIPIFFYFLVMPLQKALSGTDNKYIGLVLPAITFIFSIYTVIRDFPTIGFSISIFIFYNIPTIIFGKIYLDERKIYDNTWYNKSDT